MFQCSKCSMKFEEEKRLKMHSKTHEKKESKNKTKKRGSHLPDFDKPDFSQVM